MMRIPIRRTQIVIEERHVEAGQAAADPLRRMATIAIVANPCAGRFVDDLAPMIAASADIGRHMAAMMITAFGQHQIQSYGKGGIVWVAGEQEHANAMLTTAFANPFRDVLAGAGGDEALGAKKPSGAEFRLPTLPACAGPYRQPA